MERKGKINSYYYLDANPKSIDLEKYTKNYVELNYHYTSDLLFIDKISENAKKLGYKFEKSINTLDFNKEFLTNNFTGYQKLTVFTKEDPDECDIFPKEKIAIYRSYNYKIHTPVYNAGTSEVYKLSYTNYKNELLKRKCEEFARLFFGAEGFEYDCTYAINPINTIFIVILDYITDRTIEIFAKEHKNFVLFCLISSSSPHQIFIGPDLRMNKDSDYQKKIEELKILLGIEEVNDYL